MGRGRRRGWTGAVIAALIIGSFIVVPVAGARTTHRVTRVRGLVLRPRAGARVGSPLRVVLRTGPSLPRAVVVRLNGRDVSSYFQTVRRGRRSSMVSPSQGIRYGINTLTVTLQTTQGRRHRQRIRFTVPRGRPLAAAGPDMHVPIGSTVTLDGTGSTARPGHRRMRTRWRLVRRPRGSHARVIPVNRLLTLRRPSGGPLHPRVRINRLGTYRVALSVDDGRRSQADYATVQATPATAEVPIDTAVDGQSSPGSPTVQGIAIGSHPARHGYALPDAATGGQWYPLGSGDAAQIVVVSRQTLAPVSSASYPAGTGFIAAAQTALANLPSTDLVIVTTWPSSAWAVPGVPDGPGFVAAQLTGPKGPLSSIGATPISLGDAADSTVMESSTMSWIGVPGFPAGTDWERIGGGDYGTGGPTESVDTGLDGFLTSDPAGNYTYVAPAGVPFDLGADSPTTATLTVGASTYTGSLPAGSAGGFAVMVLHAGSLTPFNPSAPSQPGSATPLVFGTRNADGSANLAGMGAMSSFLESIDDDQVGEPLLVLVRSIGAPFPQIGAQPDDPSTAPYDATAAEAIDRLSFDVAALGGHFEWLIRLATTANADQSYSAVGRNHTAEGDTTMADTGSGVSPAPSDTELSGRLERNGRSQFAPVDTVNGPELPNPIASVMTSEPVAWPDTGTPALRLAVSCLGDAVGLGPDPRYEYWTLQTQPSDWQQKLSTLAGVTLAGAQAQPGCTGLTQAAFSTVVPELHDEFQWVANVETYISNLSAPFGFDGSYAAFTAVDSATEAVKGALPTVAPGTGSVNGPSIWSGLAGIAQILFDTASFDTVAPFVGVTSYLFGEWGTLSGDANDSASPVFSQRNTIDAAGAKIGDAVAARLQAISAGSEAMTDAIVSDYARLKDVGTHEGCVPAEPDDPACPAGWEVTQAATNATQDAFILGARRAAWGGLLPAAWPDVLYANSNPGAYNGTFLGPQTDIGGIGCGFVQVFPVTAPTYLRYDFVSDPASAEGSNTKFMVMTTGNAFGPGKFTFPPAALFTDNNLFTPVDPENVVSGPLGMDEYQMLVDNWPSDATGPPTRTDWLGCGS